MEFICVKDLLLYPTRQLGILAIIMIICAGLLYWELGFGLLNNGGFVWDEPILLALYSLRQPWLDAFFLFVSRSGDLVIVIPVLAMFVYLWRRSERITAAIYVVSVIAFPLIGSAIKNQFARPRQEFIPPLTVEHTYSFPSGHALTAVAVYGLAAVLLWQRGHRILAALSGIWVFMIGLSRVYLGAHYPSDVLASFAAGTIMLIIVLIIDKRLNAWNDKRNAA
jgi:undecaprenyl-diphosphatase